MEGQDPREERAMAVGRISGPLLKANLERNGIDLAVETDLLYIDVNNSRIGIKTNTPQYDLDVNGIISSSRINTDFLTVNSNYNIGNVNITSTVGNLVLQPGSLSDRTVILGELEVTGDLTIGGSITLGDADTDGITLDAEITSDIVPDASATYNLGSATKNWNTIWVSSIDSETEVVSFDTNGAITLPVGTTAQRPSSLAQGMIRYNTDDARFEAYNGTVWTGIGGVIDTDQDTYITAEQTADDDILRFYTAGAERLTLSATGQITAGAGYVPLANQDLVTKIYVENNFAGSGTEIDLLAGTPTDNSWLDGAYLGFTDTDLVTDVLDGLNEAIDNVRNNTFVRSVSFTGSPTAGGEGTTVTLSLTVDGNPNRYDITWGDGSVTTGTTDSTPSHTYTSNAGSPYTVTVRAYNNNATSGTTGSEASATNTDYIIIYTADPVAAFALYRNASGGSSLSGNNLYVIENNDLYMENLTTNTTMADVTYTFNWGDGTSLDNVANDSAAGGVSGSRLQHTWAGGTSTGTGRDTLTLTLASHTTANPAVIPTSATKQLKVYDPAISAPNGLSTKTISFTGSVGTSPLLASGATDNTGSTSLSAGDSVSRTTSTSGTIQSSVISTYAYDADAGILTANVNGSADGAVTFDGSDNSGTYTSLVVTDEEDYNLLNASGSSISFATSIYHPGLFTGFKAQVSKAASGVPVGINSYQLSHSTTGSTNTIEFVKDNVTATPTLTSGTLTENVAGTYRYISGVPYYNTGSPSLTLSGVTLNNFIGQTYRNTSQVVQVVSGTNYEGTSQNAISGQSFTYANIDGTVSFLTGGIPNANTGNGTPYAIGDLTVSLTSSSVRTVETITSRAYNVNGSGSYSSQTEKIAVHTASQSGISEIAIDVSGSLGATYSDDAVRIFDFNAETTDNPTFNSATNFYTNNPYTEASDPGVVGTKEATIRIGVLEHNVEDYSTGYLPVGPNRSGDTGTQYFTMAFRRTTVANFNINITSTTGISGLWIAAPGTAIDSASSINGWLDTGIQYAGSGVPGANTGAGGNGSNGCASTGGDIIGTGVSLSGSYTQTLGTENMTNATGNVVLVRIALAANEKVTALSIS